MNRMRRVASSSIDVASSFSSDVVWSFRTARAKYLTISSVVK